MRIADVIILSNAKNEGLYELTKRAVKSCIETSDGLCDVLVIEQNKSREYNPLADTLYTNAPFNYNKFANVGAELTKKEWIVIANNYLIFHEGWLTQLLKANYPIVSPKCPNYPLQRNIERNTVGWQVGCHLSGWCFMIKRSLWEQIGKFDTRFEFYCADDSLIQQLRIEHKPPMLVPSSRVTHLVSTTLKTVTPEEKEYLTNTQVRKFNTAFNKNVFGIGKIK